MARRLGQQRRVLCASPDALRPHGVSANLAALSGHRCLASSNNGPPLAWSVHEGGTPRLCAPHAAHQFSDGEAMVDAAVAGLGTLQLPVSMVREPLNAGRLQEVLTEFAGPDVEIHAVWPHRAQLSPRIRFVVDPLLAFWPSQDGLIDRVAIHLIPQLALEVHQLVLPAGQHRLQGQDRGMQQVQCTVA